MLGTCQTKILIADRDMRMAESLKLLLASAADRILIARSAEEVGFALNNDIPDLLLIDLGLAGMETYDLIHRVQQRDPAIPILLTSAAGDPESALSAMNLGAHGYLKKPFEPVELINRISRALNQVCVHRKSGAINAKDQTSAQRYRFLVENSPDLIYALDDHGRFTFANRTLKRVLGYPKGTLIGRSYHKIVYHRDNHKARWVFNERRTGRRALKNTELRLLRKNGGGQASGLPQKSLTVELMAVGLYDKPAKRSDKKFLGTCGVARVVSRRKLSEERLFHERKMEALGTLVGGIAHNFNNLLMGIQGYTDLLLTHCRACPTRDAAKLRHIQDLVQSGAELTQKLVGFACGGKYLVQTVDLNELIIQTLRLFVTKRRDVHVETDLGPGPYMIRADAGQIKRVFFNLFINAYQSMPGGGKLRIVAQPRKMVAGRLLPAGCAGGDYVRIQVSDTGAGMSSDTLDNAFDPFFTTLTHKGNVGLGLAETHGILKNHGGTIRAASVIGKGSVFTILLPLNPDPGPTS